MPKSKDNKSTTPQTRAEHSQVLVKVVGKLIKKPGQTLVIKSSHGQLEMTKTAIVIIETIGTHQRRSRFNIKTLALYIDRKRTYGNSYLNFSEKFEQFIQDVNQYDAEVFYKTNKGT